MKKITLEQLFLLLMGLVISLMLMNIMLFWRLNQLQQVILGQFRPNAPDGLEVGTLAPEFKLPDINGNEISLSEFQGEPLVMMFSQVGCNYCREMYPQVKAFQEKYPQIHVLMISTGTEEENRALLEEQGFSFPVLIENGELVSVYKVPGTPFFYFIDAEGMVVQAGNANSLSELEVMVEALK